MSESGQFASAFETLCGFSKLFGGILVDLFDPSAVVAVCSLVCGVVNLLMFRFEDISVSKLLWGINGFCQALGWPALSRSLFVVFPKPQERGSWYSILATSQSVGGALTPFILQGLVVSYGWRSALVVPGAVGVVFAVIAFLGLRPFDPPKPTTKTSFSDIVQALQKDVFTSPAMWCMGIGYFFISIIRTAVSTWAFSMLTNNPEGNTMVPTFLFVLEAGSFVGGIGAGVVSDKVFNGNRFPPMVLSGLLCAASLLALSQATTLAPVFSYACVACVGAFAFAPHMLFGLAAREVVPSNVASTAGGFVKAIGQLGGAVAGAPFGALLQGPGWWAGHSLLIASAVASAVSVMPLLRRAPAEKPKSS